MSAKQEDGRVAQAGKRQKRAEEEMNQDVAYVVEEGKVVRVDRHGNKVPVDGQDRSLRGNHDLEEAADDGDSSQYEYVDEEDHGSLANDDDESVEDEDEDSLEDDEISDDEEEYIEEVMEEGCDLLMDKLELPSNLSPQFYKFYEEFTTQMDFIIKYEYNLRPSVPAAYLPAGQNVSQRAAE